VLCFNFVVLYLFYIYVVVFNRVMVVTDAACSLDLFLQNLNSQRSLPPLVVASRHGEQEVGLTPPRYRHCAATSLKIYHHCNAFHWHFTDTVLTLD
jgi:hypothetical protein